MFQLCLSYELVKHCGGISNDKEVCRRMGAVEQEIQWMTGFLILTLVDLSSLPLRDVFCQSCMLDGIYFGATDF